jgi:hypothetical protein
MIAGFTKIFLLENTTYGLMIGPPPFMNNGQSEEPNMLWFGYFIDNCDQINISGRFQLPDIIDLLNEETSDEIIFNLDLFV